MTLTQHHRRPAGRALGRRFADILADPFTGEGTRTVLARPDVVPFEAVPFAMLIANCHGQVLAANKSWAELSGITVPSSLGEGWMAALGNEAARVAEEVRRVIAGGIGSRFDCSLGTCWTSPYHWAGEALVGIAFTPAPRIRTTGWRFRLLAELPALCDELERVVNQLERELIPASAAIL